MTFLLRWQHMCLLFETSLAGHLVQQGVLCTSENNCVCQTCIYIPTCNQGSACLWCGGSLYQSLSRITSPCGSGGGLIWLVQREHQMDVTLAHDTTLELG